ncbi:hypothetical protein DFP72DRAFT_1076859 [Ephemerocybe angulata]|uniref:Uncharacterized protein n=1 Tax=Ephemerocybe angulata TaxID=980116 RepID=A0A8H6LYL1_9AGAR|nr:hypothetical protein DFP72DRAFT_1076859 [Tulosesus angulatus]
MSTDEIMPPTGREAPSSSSNTYTPEQLKEFLERNWNVICDQNRYLVEGSETAVRCSYCKEVVELGEDPFQREVTWAAHLELDKKRRPFIDDPHCNLIPGFGTKVFCSPCNKEIELTRPWLRQPWDNHVTTVSHLRNIGENTTLTPYEVRHQRFAEDPAAILLSDLEVQCAVCRGKIQLRGPWGWSSWAAHLKSQTHQARVSWQTS